VLCSTDAALLEIWRGVRPPAGWRLESAPHPLAEHFAPGRHMLVLVDARAFLEDDALAEVVDAAPERCVWIGPAASLDCLGPARLGRAYDVVATPTSAPVLERRLQEWLRSIRQTAALQDVGRRVEVLAEQNDRLTARLLETETHLATLARQRERLDQVLASLRQVARLSREINSLDLERIGRVAVDQLPRLVAAHRASLYLYEAASDRLVLQAHSHGRPVTERVDLKENPHSPMATAVRRGELLLVTDFAEFQRRFDVVLDREFAQEYATGSCIIAPLKGGARVRGVLNLADKEGGGPFDPEIDLAVVEQIAALVGASIYNVELYREMERRAKTDPLTDLPNRRALEEALARETDRSRRYGAPFSILMFDVDQLKRVNDQYGHEIGDQVLKHVAGVLGETVRSVDIPGRWAGDEFLVVLPDTGAVAARRLAKRLLANLREHPPAMEDPAVFAGLSAGVAQYKKDESAVDLVRRADKAMYEAKKAGGERIMAAP
jgi:diguanylate cyclase (GGDEF)-like protein